MIRTVAERLTGLDVGGEQSLARLEIRYRRGGTQAASVRTLFNPAEISRSRSVHWEASARPAGFLRSAGRPSRLARQFLSIEPETLDITLLFDTYGRLASHDNVMGNLVQQATLGRAYKGVSVTKYTDEVLRLAQVDPELHHPPVCTLFWGRYGAFFTGVLARLEQSLTMFLPDGTPVRATLQCSFQEVSATDTAGGAELKSADVVKTRVLRRGESLQSLAAAEYGDARLWRHIAVANGISNPRTVAAGTRLTVPKLTGDP